MYRSKSMLYLVLVAALALVLCRCDCNGGGETDSGSTPQDATRADAGQIDHAAGQDHTVRDSAQPHDSAVADAHAGDSTADDSHVPDGGIQDSHVVDGGASDSHVADTTIADSTAIDSHADDAGGAVDSATGADSSTADTGSSVDAAHGPPDWSALGVGFRMVGAIAPDHTLWQWGWSACGSGPCQVGTDIDWSAIGGSGSAASCAIKNSGTLWCWGNNSDGALGVGDTSNRAVPTEVLGDSTWLQVDMNGAGDLYNATCGIKGDHSLWCWGTAGQYASHTPIHVGTDSDWHQMDVGANAVCGIRTGGALYCSGTMNGFTRLGATSTWLEVAVWSQICALNDQSEIWCWSDPAATATQVPGSHVWRSVTVGGFNYCAIDDNAAIWCWGENGNGQLGTGNNDNAAEPTLVVGGAQWRIVQAGYQFTCGVRTDDSMWCWGNNKYGQLGDGHTTNRNVPIQVFRP